jgi:HK97 family phage portal protein
MDFFSFLPFARSAKRAAPNDYGGTWIPLGGTDATITDRTLLDANREWVFICTNRIASSIAGLRYKVMRYQSTKDDQEVFEGPLVDFLEKPAPDLTGKDFIYLNTAYKELTGNAFWEKISNREVAPLIPTRVYPVIEHGELTAFRYAGLGAPRILALDDVLHDRYAALGRPWWGEGKLQKITRWVDTSSYLTEFMSRFFVNGATFGGFIETEEESEERIKLIKLGLKSEHVGVANAHKMGVLPKGAKYTKATANMAEMEMGDTDARYRDKILAAFGVPKALIGLAEEVQRGNVEASEYIFAKYTLKPIADDLIEFLNTSVAPMLDPSGRFYFAYDDFIPDDQAQKQAERESALGKQPYMTINEVRASVGLGPVDNGDVILGDPRFQPLGTPAPAPIVPPANDNQDPPQPKKAMPARARVAFARERAIDAIVKDVAAIVETHSDPDAEAHKSFVSRAEAHQDQIAGQVRDFNGKQQREVVSRLKQITKAVKKSDLFDMEREVGLLIDVVSPILKGLMLEQAIAEYEAQGFAGQLDSGAAIIRATADLAARRLAKSYNATTATLIASTLNEGIAAGEDLTQLTERVHAVYDYSNSVRAQMVAETEAFYIANEGSREAYRQSGVVKSMRWYTAEDERVCEFCGPEDGRIVDINEPFYEKGTTLQGSDGGTLDLDYRTIDVPPLHPRCRCFIRPEVIDIT